MPGPRIAGEAGQAVSPEDLVRALRAQGIADRRVLAAFRTIPRARFVPAAAAHLAYLDQPIRIPHAQVTTQPSLLAQMVAALRLAGSERVLEVGTGLGFQTAILALLADQVVSIERFADLAAQARANLAAVGLGHVRVVVGDGTLGVPAYAPYHAVVVAAAAPRVPTPLVEQLAGGGRLVQPIGPGGRELVTVFHKDRGHLVADAQLTLACFVPLVRGHSAPAEESGLARQPRPGGTAFGNAGGRPGR